MKGLKLEEAIAPTHRIRQMANKNVPIIYSVNVYFAVKNIFLSMFKPNLMVVKNAKNKAIENTIQN